MATLLPDNFPPNGEASERKVFVSLATLGEDWWVLHDVPWLFDGREGQADFVVVHPRIGLVVLEVKGGGLSVRDGMWFSVDRHRQEHEIRDPFGQAQGG